MMKYIVIKGCVINKAPAASGSVVSLNIDQAKELLDMQRIAPYYEPQLEDRSVGLEISEDRPILRKKGKAGQVCR